MDNKDEALIIATKALNNLLMAAKDSYNHTMSATYVKYTTELALAKIEQLKQR